MTTHKTGVYYPVIHNVEGKYSEDKNAEDIVSLTLKGHDQNMGYNLFSRSLLAQSKDSESNGLWGIKLSTDFEAKWGRLWLYGASKKEKGNHVLAKDCNFNSNLSTYYKLSVG